MYSWLFRHFPGPLWMRAVTALTIAAAVVLLLMTSAFPWLSQFNPLTQSTLSPATNALSEKGGAEPPNTASSAAEPVVLPAPSTVPADITALGDRVQESLSSLASATPRPNREQMTAAFNAAGAASAVEVTADLTPTGLEPDAAVAAVRAGDFCIFGHVRDGQATASILPPLANGGCFIGSHQ